MKKGAWVLAARLANILLFLAWLGALSRQGLLIDLTMPVAALAAYALMNAVFFWKFSRPNRYFETGWLAADIGLILWLAVWARGEAEVHTALLFPLTLAAFRSPTPAAAVLTIFAAGAAAILPHDFPETGIADRALHIAALLLIPWGLSIFASADQKNGEDTVRGKTSLHRSVIFQEFLSHILFQMREYLTSITTVSSHLAATTPDDSGKDLALKLQKLIAELNGKVTRMFDTVESHSTTRRPAAAPEFALSSIIQNSLEISSSACPVADLKVRLWCDPHIPLLKGDRELLTLVFATVLENSLEAFQARGQGGNLNISAKLAGETAQVEIVDEAGGMPSEIIEKVFNPLHTTKAKSGHVGLGLSMVRRMLERYGGTLSVRSENGRTMVLVEAPLKPSLPRIREGDSTWAGRRDKEAYHP